MALYSIGPCFHHRSYPQLGVVLLWLHLFILSGVISPLISSSILGTYWSGEFIFSVLSFCLFILFMGFPRQEYWSGLPFLSLVDHILSEVSTMTYPSWVALHIMAHSFIELDKIVVDVIRLVSFLWLWFEPMWLWTRVLGLRPSQNPVWGSNLCDWVSKLTKTLLGIQTHMTGTQTQPKPTVPGFRI